jgi:hypothetical protein
MFFILGMACVGCVVSAYAAYLVLRGRLSKLFTVTTATALGLGLTLGAILASREVTSSETMRVFGWPFPVAILEFKDQQWIDYVGSPLTALANFFILLGLPQILNLFVIGTIVTTRRLAARVGIQEVVPRIAAQGPATKRNDPAAGAGEKGKQEEDGPPPRPKMA